MPYRKDLLVVGSGGHAEACIDVINSEKKFSIIGLLDKKYNKVFNKYEVISDLKDFKKIKKISKNVFIAIGHIKSPRIKIDIYKKLKEYDFNFPKIISSKAITSNHCEIGNGTIIMHGAFIGPNVKIGKNCIINTNAHIEHGSVIGDNSHISTSVVLNGNVKVGSETFIGSGSVIREGIIIPKKSFIKMGTVKTR